MRRWRSLPRPGGVKSIAPYPMWYVYILRSEKDGGLYIGCTNNLERRVKEHNSGYTVSTSRRRPFKILYTEEYGNSHEAYSREKTLKGYKGGEALKKLLGEK